MKWHGKCSHRAALLQSLADRASLLNRLDEERLKELGVDLMEAGVKVYVCVW